MPLMVMGPLFTRSALVAVPIGVLADSGSMVSRVKIGFPSISSCLLPGPFFSPTCMAPISVSIVKSSVKGIIVFNGKAAAGIDEIIERERGSFKPHDVLFRDLSVQNVIEAVVHAIEVQGVDVLNFFFVFPCLVAELYILHEARLCF